MMIDKTQAVLLNWIYNKSYEIKQRGKIIDGQDREPGGQGYLPEARGQTLPEAGGAYELYTGETQGPGAY
jgi:hypothetical protein